MLGIFDHAGWSPHHTAGRPNHTELHQPIVRHAQAYGAGPKPVLQAIVRRLDEEPFLGLRALVPTATQQFDKTDVLVPGALRGC